MDEPTPLYVLITRMQEKWRAKEWPEAVALARLAAPYVHGRAPMARQGGELAGVPDDELDEWDGGRGKAAS